MELNWTCQTFRELNVNVLYAILQLRIEVFDLEQNCIYQDADDKDQACHHLCGWDGDRLAAYCRIVPAGLSFDHPSIGRVVTAPDYRRAGLGKQLMEKAIQTTKEQMNDLTIIISAQLYLKRFYESFGFIQISDIYLEDDIQHILMVKNTSF